MKFGKSKPTITVAGAGIAGPTAALALANRGYDVTLFERRMPGDFDSLHMMWLDEDTQAVLMNGLGIPQRELYRYTAAQQPIYKEMTIGGDVVNHAGVPYSPPGGESPECQWNDLHDALVKRCTVQYGHAVTTQPQTDVVIWADGVDSFGRRTHSSRRGTYGGEMIIRGAKPRKASDMTWYMSSDMMHAYDLVSYPCWERDGSLVRGWTLFLKCPQLWDGTHTLSASEQDFVLSTAKEVMSRDAFGSIDGSTGLIGSPQLEWPNLKHLYINQNGQAEFFIGDALGSVSPRTTRGANDGTQEGYTLAQLNHRQVGEWDAEWVRKVNDVFAESRAQAQAIRNPFMF